MSNQFSACCQPNALDLGITWIVFLGFFIWSMVDQLPPPCYPFISPLSLSLLPPSPSISLLPRPNSRLSHSSLSLPPYLPTYAYLPMFILPASPYTPISTYLSLPTYVFQPMCVNLPSSTYLSTNLPTYVNLQTNTNICQPTIIYLPTSTYLPMSTYHHLPTSSNP